MKKTKGWSAWVLALCLSLISIPVYAADSAQAAAPVITVTADGVPVVFSKAPIHEGILDADKTGGSDNPHLTATECSDLIPCIWPHLRC